MVKDTDLHLYLNEEPEPKTFLEQVRPYGFIYTKTDEATKTDPTVDYYYWGSNTTRGSGFRLLFFHSLYPDDLNHGKFSSFLILSGHQSSSDLELSMVDAMSVMLIRQYGGFIHNPQRIDKISTGFLLSGTPFSKFTKRP